MGQSKMDNTEKLAAYGRQGEDKHSTKKHNVCWTPIFSSKHK